MPTTVVDERGRVLIPKNMRRAKHLTPGQPVQVDQTSDGVVIRPVLSRKEALKRLEGAINEKTLSKHAEKLDPLDLKKIWEPKV